MKPRFITKEEAYKAAMKAGFRVEDTDSSDFGRTLIHCFSGMFGADWDKDGVLKAISQGEKYAWVNHWGGHNLAVQTKDSVYYFDIKEKNDKKGKTV